MARKLSCLSDEEKTRLLLPLYMEGLSDEMISLRVLGVEQIKIGRSCIRNWRVANGLEANGHGDFTKKLIGESVKKAWKRIKKREKNIDRRSEKYRTARAKVGSHNYDNHTEDQIEFLMACNERMKQLGRVSGQTLSPREILEVAYSLGYRRVE